MIFNFQSKYFDLFIQLLNFIHQFILLQEHFIIFYLIIMTQRKAWTSFEDEILKQLKQIRNITKWTEIATIMKKQFKIQDRTGKQCRQRYHNHLDSKIIKKQWSKQEDELIYQLHNKYGNKWAIIAQNLNGRTDNYVKNHFYSKLRKAIRKLNKIIEENYKKTLKEFKIIDLYKIIQASEDKFKETSELQKQGNKQSNSAHELKNKLFVFAEDEIEFPCQQSLQLIMQINQFCKFYRRKPKKSRRYSPMCADSVYRVSKKQNKKDLSQNNKDISDIQDLEEIIIQNEEECHNIQMKQQVLNKKQQRQGQQDLTFSLNKGQNLCKDNNLTKTEGKVEFNFEQNTELERKQKKQRKQRKQSEAISFSDMVQQNKYQPQVEEHLNGNNFRNMVMTFKSQVNFNSFSYSVVEDFQFE